MPLAQASVPPRGCCTAMRSGPHFQAVGPCDPPLHLLAGGARRQGEQLFQREEGLPGVPLGPRAGSRCPSCSHMHCLDLRNWLGSARGRLTAQPPGELSSRLPTQAAGCVCAVWVSSVPRGCRRHTYLPGGELRGSRTRAGCPHLTTSGMGTQPTGLGGELTVAAGKVTFAQGIIAVISSSYRIPCHQAKIQSLDLPRP